MLRVTNPYNGRLVAKIPWDRIEIPRPVRRPFERVKRGIEYFRKHAEPIAREITLQMGKPIVQARREVATMIHRAETMLSIAPSALKPDVLPAPKGFHLRIEHVPWGVVLDIGAWNYPLLIPINVIVPAMLAGNAVILKHSAKTPLCGRRFEEAFGIRSLVLTHGQTKELIRKVDYVAFTGSTEGGREIYRQAAERLIDAGLELGGKDPAYVAEDADLDFTVENVVDGACYNAGQSCCSVERVYVHRKLYREFLKRAKAVMERYRMGDPMDESTTLGPLADRSALARLRGRVRRSGGRVLLGGEPQGPFFPPTLVADVPQDSELMQEESFGPIVPVRAVSGDREALRLMNDTRYGLTASVWTRRRQRAEEFAGGLRVGTVFQNRCDYLDPSLAWTGFGESGLGSTLSRYGFLFLTRRRSLHFRSRR